MIWLFFYELFVGLAIQAPFHIWLYYLVLFEDIKYAKYYYEKGFGERR